MELTENMKPPIQKKQSPNKINQKRRNINRDISQQNCIKKKKTSSQNLN